MADLVPVVRALRPLTNEKPALRTPPRARRCRVHRIPPYVRDHGQRPLRETLLADRFDHDRYRRRQSIFGTDKCPLFEESDMVIVRIDSSRSFRG